MRAWDFVHCPPMTAHTFVAKEAGPCVILATETGATILSACARDPRSRSATTRDPRSIRQIPSAEDHGRFGVQHDGTSCRGPNGRSGGCAAASAVVTQRVRPRPSRAPWVTLGRTRGNKPRLASLSPEWSAFVVVIRHESDTGRLSPRRRRDRGRECAPTSVRVSRGVGTLTPSSFSRVRMRAREGEGALAARRQS